MEHQKVKQTNNAEQNSKHITTQSLVPTHTALCYITQKIIE